MAKISLRAYNREIENLIDRGQTDHAIAHCKYILKQFPKHITTYRLLGKAYLESQRFTEAADILQRVLAAIPEDFVSHLGMSIIREDEGDLDAAIWHMERAFEVQPSNNAVQDELRRLYGRRDGIEPPRVRLTRGALVRMYARGELYPQAIAEARAALAEDPTRVDIETILARVYFLAGRKLEATEISSRLVTKLPYCLDANRILAEILPGTSRAEDAKSFQQTVIALDPYYAFVSKVTPQSDDVPENAVVVEQLEYEGAKEEQNPEWARTIGADLGEFNPETPEWMSPMQGTAQSQQSPERTAPPSPSETAVPHQPEAEKANEIPEWMANAGWTPGTGDAAAEQNQFEEENSLGSEDIAPAEIPDWLKSLAPEEETESISDEDQERFAALESILPKIEPESPISHQIEDQQGPVSEVPAGSDLDSKFDTTPSSDAVLSGEASNELPEWLQFDESPEPASAASQESETGDESPAAPAAPVETGDEQSITGWLRGLGFNPDAADIQPTGPVEPTLQDTQAIPTEPEDARPEIDSEKPTEANDIDAAMAWLESLAARQGADEDLLTTPPEQRRETPPEWLNEDEAAQRFSQPTGTESFDHPSEAQISSDEPLPTSGTNQDEVVHPGTEATASVSQTNQQPDQDLDAAMAWLESLAANQGANEELLTTPPENRTDNPPDWIRRELDAASNTMDETRPVAHPQEDLNAAETRPIDINSLYSEPSYDSSLEKTIPIHPLSEDEASTPQPDLDFAWLESLAAQHGASEDELFTKPEERSEQPPTWVKEEDATPQSVESDQVSVPQSEMESVDQAASIQPEEVNTFEEIPQEKAVEEEAGIPDWLSDLVVENTGISEPERPMEVQVPVNPAESPSSTISGHVEAEPEPVVEESSKPTFTDMQEPPEAVVSAQPESVETTAKPEEKRLPEWLKNLDSDQIVEETIVTIEPAPEEEPVFGVEMNEEAVIPISVEKEDTLPEWLRAVDQETGQSAPLNEQAPVTSGQAQEVVTNESENVKPVEAEPAIDRQPAARTGDSLSEFESARTALSNGKIETALVTMNRMIESDLMLDDIISELRSALYRYPVDVSLWQLLGDAYLHSNRIQDALDSYTKAEELLR